MAKKSGKPSKQSKAAKKSKRPESGKGGADQVEARVLLRAPEPPVRLAEIDTGSHTGVKDRADAEAQTAVMAGELVALQEKLFAEGRERGNRSVLLVIQGMDTSGKGGVLSHVIGQLEPMGCEIHSFKAPTAEERRHDFLWRFRNRLPESGMVGVWDRSHYEDVLIVRVHNLVPRSTWSRRYATINRFEQSLAAQGVTLIKCMLHISKDEQQRRLLDRLSDPAKYWKYNPGDVDERGHWDAYQQAYEAVLDKTNTESAPWHVIPADHKWYRNWAISKLLLEHLRALDPQWPPADFDVEAERQRVLAAG